MKIHFLKEDALIALKSNVQANVVNYRKPTNEWIHDYFQGDDPFMEANFECEDFQLCVSSDSSQVSATDAQNARIIYSAMKGLSDTQATDERLWAGLCHYDFWDYMLVRCALNTEEKLDSQVVLSRYFFSTAKKRSLSMNMLSKLWWLGRWVYDPHRADPFELVKYFETDFTTKLYMIFSNNYMNNREIAQGVIEALMQLEQEQFELTESNDSKQSNIRQIFLKATSFLNVFGGTHILDFFTKDEIKTKVIEYMHSLPHIKTAGVSVNVEPEIVRDTTKVIHYPSVKTSVIDVKDQQGQSEKDSIELTDQNQNTETRQHETHPKDQNHLDSMAFEETVPETVRQISADRTHCEKTTGMGSPYSKMDAELVAYCEDMRLSYSYKAVLLMALLEYVENDGRMNIEKAVPFFRDFYRKRLEKGLAAELKSSIYSDPKVDDARILSNIIRNPLNALLLSNYFDYDSDRRRFGFKTDVWSGITNKGREKMLKATKERLAEYYKEL